MGFVQNVFLGVIIGFAGCLYYLAAAKRRRAARDGDAAVKGTQCYNFSLIAIWTICWISTSPMRAFLYPYTLAYCLANHQATLSI
jgi:hypothetical protein